MGHPGSIERAIGLYRSHHSRQAWLGPALLLTAAELAQANRIRDDMIALAGEAVKVSHRCLRVQSAWHAAIMLICLQQSFLGNRTHLLFRGQAVPTWTLSTSLGRAADKQRAGRATAAFCALLASVWPESATGVAMPDVVPIATAQHYGLPTHLFDFTPDPSVAVHFADDRRFAGDMARVFILPLVAAKQLNAAIVLPPPFVSRLYAQLGVFVEVADEGAVMEKLTEVEFPIDAALPPFEVMRHDKTIDLLPEDTWLSDAAAWARTWAEQAGDDFPADPALRNPILLNALGQIGYPSFATNPFKLQLQLAEWIDFFGEMLYWLVIVVEKEGEYYDGGTLKMIVAANPSLIRIVIPVFARLAMQERHQEPALARNRLKLVRLLRDMLTS